MGEIAPVGSIAGKLFLPNPAEIVPNLRASGRPECGSVLPQLELIARDDFKEFIRTSGMTHVRTSPYYPQSNGKIERWYQVLKSECIRPGTRLSLGDALRLVRSYVEHYNNVCLNSAIGYITPTDMLAGRQQEIHSERDRKLAAARQQRQVRRQQSA